MSASGSGSLLVIAVVERRDEDAHAFVHLRRGKADATILDHRIDHVVDQLLNHRLLQSPRRAARGFRAQHRMAHARDFQDRHICGIILV